MKHERERKRERKKEEEKCDYDKIWSYKLICIRAKIPQQHMLSKK